jgi:5-methylcytosine-specific restriction endonuclease McrA
MTILDKETTDALYTEHAELQALFEESEKDRKRFWELNDILCAHEKATKNLETRLKRNGIKKYRKHILEANGNMCFVCENKMRSVLIVHHIIPVSEGGNNEMDNLVVLCPNCHAVVHRAQQLKRSDRDGKIGRQTDVRNDVHNEFTRRQLQKLMPLIYPTVPPSTFK